jgi:hypothetical protein
VSSEILSRVKADIPFSELFTLTALNKAATPTKVRLSSLLTLPSAQTNVCGTYYQDYKVSGGREVPEEPKLQFQVHILDLTSDDKHSMQLNSKHIPKPITSDRRSAVFHLPIGPSIVYESNFLNRSFLHFKQLFQLLSNS